MTFLLLIITTLVFAAQCVSWAYHLPGLSNAIGYLTLNLDDFKHGFAWQLVTYQFLHTGFLHFFFNALMLFMFGRAVESSLGRTHFLTLYFLSGVIGGLVQMLLAAVVGQFFSPAVMGASASVLGLLAAFAILDPDQQIMFFALVPLRAIHLFWFSIGISLFFIVVPVDKGQAHAAHLGGLLAGAAYIKWIIRSPVSFRIPQIFKRQTTSRRTLRAQKKIASRRSEEELEGDLPPGEFISREVDPILEKISAQGLQSLTPHERKILEAARSKMERRV
ncbi:MAG TPA: rhomboid family intramembrane serine protease [Verrucomicrobiae bacterium]